MSGNRPELSNGEQMRYESGRRPGRWHTAKALLGRTLFLSSVLALAAPAAAQVPVDNFTTGQGPLQIPPGATPSTVSGVGIMGTERDLTLQRNSGSGTVSAVATGGVFTFSAGASTSGEALLTWDGTDGNAVVLDPLGLAGTDLT